jgi:hypothetical protein
MKVAPFLARTCVPDYRSARDVAALLQRLL